MTQGTSTNDGPGQGELVPVVLDAVRMHTETGQHALLLREQAGDRVLRLWVGPFEANAAAMRLNSMAPARPITHDLLATLLERAGATVERVVVSRLHEEIYYAVVHLAAAAGPEEVDARPSDAINIALRCGAPILVAASILDAAAVRPDAADAPRPPAVVAMAVEAETGQHLGLFHLGRLPDPGDQVAVPYPTGWRVVSVEPAAGEEPAHVVVRRPTPE